VSEQGTVKRLLAVLVRLQKQDVNTLLCYTLVSVLVLGTGISSGQLQQQRYNVAVMDAWGRFQFTDARHLHFIFRHFCCLTFTNFMSITVITNPCISNIITGTCPAYCFWPRCHHSQTINLCPTAVRNCPRLPEKVVHHIVLQQYHGVINIYNSMSSTVSLKDRVSRLRRLTRSYTVFGQPQQSLCLWAPATEQVVPGSPLSLSLSLSLSLCCRQQLQLCLAADGMLSL